MHSCASKLVGLIDSGHLLLPTPSRITQYPDVVYTTDSVMDTVDEQVCFVVANDSWGLLGSFCSVLEPS